MADGRILAMAAGRVIDGHEVSCTKEEIAREIETAASERGATCNVTFNRHDGMWHIRRREATA